MGSLPPGMRSRSSGNQPYLLASWQTMLLPYIEQGAYGTRPWRPIDNPARRSKTRRTSVWPPSSRLSPVPPIRADQVQFAPRDKFYVALTCYLGVEGQDLYSRDGVLFRDSAIRFADITDGTSTTLLAGERPASTDFQFGWWYAGAGQRFSGSAEMVLGVREKNVMLVTKGSCPPGTYSYAPGRLSNQCDMYHFWSPHIGGAFFLFADGSAHFLGYDAATVLPALASRAGNETDTLPD